jgi:hypothetical protein
VEGVTVLKGDLDSVELETVLDEPFTLFKEPGVSARLGNSIFLEQVFNQIVEESLTDLIPYYKEVLSRTPLHIFFGRKTHIGSCPKTKPEIPTVEVVGCGNKELLKKKWYILGGLEK